MQKIFFYILPLLLFAACAGKTDPAEGAQEASELEFVPDGGTPLAHFVDMPGVDWSVDTIYGLCAPDTFVLWMSYNGHDYLTNVRGVEDGDFPLLSQKGSQKLAKNLAKPSFVKTDFTDMATLTYTQTLTREDFLALRDTVYMRNIENLKSVVEDFYYSLGQTKYMAGNLAANWAVIMAQSDAEGAKAPNPFNNAPSIEFDPGSVSVHVPYPKEGIVEVAAYCLDPFTLGYPGWAYWTVKMCRERGQFKVKEMPARHRKFTTG